MDRISRGLMALTLVAFVAARHRGAPVEEYSAPTAIPAVTVEPVFTGKYN